MIKLILSSAAFQLRYKCDVRLVPNFDRNSGPYIQDKIRRCIVQHGQFCKCVNSNTCEGIEFLDVKNTILQRTIRQLIMDLLDTHFINIYLTHHAISKYIAHYSLVNFASVLILTHMRVLNFLMSTILYYNALYVN